MENREYKKVIKYIKNEIIKGNLTIGDKLPTERFLAEKLGISRNSIREAIRTMENMGMLESKQGSGNYLTGNLGKMFVEGIGIMLLLKQINYEEVYELRKTIELEAYELAVKNISKSDLTKLEILIEKMKNSNGHDLVKTDKKFHYLIIKASNNNLILHIMQAIEDIYTNSVEHILLNSSDEIKTKLLEIHKSILLGITQKDVASGKIAIEEHYSIIDKTTD